MPRKARRDYVYDDTTSRAREREALKAIETAPPPAGKEHRFVLQPDGGRACAYCKRAAKDAEEGRCVPESGIYWGGRVPQAYELEKRVRLRPKTRDDIDW